MPKNSTPNLLSTERLSPESPPKVGADEETRLLFLRNSYNKLYCDIGFDVVELCVADNGMELGAIFGIKTDVMLSPFSAPFGGIWSSGPVTTMDYCDFSEMLIEYARDKGINRIQITLPAECYTSANVKLQLDALTTAGYHILYSDINHSIDLTKDFRSNLKRGARRSLAKAEAAGLTFLHADSSALCRRAYEVVKRNRQQKEKPLKLSYKDISRVSSVTDIQYFLVTQGEQDIAGGVVFQISRDVSQVVYWGNDVNYNSLNSIHFLAMHLWAFYKDRCKFLDIGPSSSIGAPDDGLVAFKESIGCVRTLKHTLSWLSENSDADSDSVHVD